MMTTISGDVQAIERIGPRAAAALQRERALRRRQRLLTGTTAIVSAGFAAGASSPAEAQVEGIEIGLGGFLNEFFYITDVDEDDDTQGDFNEVAGHFDGEIFFEGSTTLDNGVRFGVNIQLEVPTSGDQIDEAFMFIDSALGQFQLGGENTAMYVMGLGLWDTGIGVPINSGWVSDFSPPPPGATVGFRSPSMSTAIDVINDDNAFTYFTPRVGGFQFGATFAPSADFGGNPRNGTIDTEGFNYHNAVSVGLNYVETFGAFDVGISGGYAQAQAGDAVEDAGGDDIEQFMAGANLGWQGFTLTGSYAEEFEGRLSDGGAVSTEGESWIVGLLYDIDSWSFGVAYTEGDVEGEVAIPGDDERTSGVLSVGYNIGPGIDAAGSLLFTEWDTDEGQETDAIAFGGGFKLSF